jgi:hypothetical protein
MSEMLQTKYIDYILRNTITKKLTIKDKAFVVHIYGIIASGYAFTKKNLLENFVLFSGGFVFKPGKCQNQTFVELKQMSATVTLSDTAL